MVTQSPLPWGVEQRVPTCPDCIRILLPRTDWAKRFRKEASPSLYKEALSRAGQPVQVFFSNETGEDLWAVSLEDSFWMDAFPTEQEALQLVEEMGWPKL